VPSILHLDELEVIQLFRKPGGAEFAYFCAEIIHASCGANGISLSEVHTTKRTDAKDGGVDTRVAVGMPRDRSGYFGKPTAWQFKAVSQRSVTGASLKAEAKKPFARKCIQDGHGYRICICDHLTPEKRSKLEKALAAQVKRISRDAPPPRVLGIAEICQMANVFPALVMRYRPGISGLCILFERWRENARSVTPKFVPNPALSGLRDAILGHLDFSRTPGDAVLAVHGSSGVGKTRAVFESIAEKNEVASLVLYSSNEDRFSELANLLTNYQPAVAIVVADECSLASRVALSQQLIGVRDRIRCICIDNSTELPGSPHPELLVRKPNDADLEAILTSNFPSIPPDRVRLYARLSSGFVRIAADMCGHFDETISQAGDMTPIADKLRDYFIARLGTQERMKAVEAVSLLKRVKRKGASPTELESICRLLGEDVKVIEENLAVIKDAPGFVERTALYYRVTPELIAAIAFEAAWQRWVDDDAVAFLERLPDDIHSSFLERVSEGRNDEVRETVRDFFRRFADSFTPSDLGKLDLVTKLTKVVETDPAIYLPQLLRILEQASPPEIRADSDLTWLGSSNPRRQLVWLAEQLVQFNEYFYECEKILYVLAINESEPSISNNATHIWQQCFRIYLSGTSTPFSDRLSVLRQRLENASSDTSDVLLGALGGLLEFRNARILGPPVVGGRLVPKEWRPEPNELISNVMNAFEFLLSVSKHPVPEVAAGAVDILVKDLAYFAQQGWVDQLRGLLGDSFLDEGARARLVSQLRMYLSVAEKFPERTPNEEYRKRLMNWVSELEPQTLHGRLIEVVGTRAWDYHGKESEWEARLTGLALEITDRHELEKELDWLTSKQALSSFEFGFALGKLQSGSTILFKVIDYSIERELGFARGLIAGLLSKDDFDATPVNKKLDDLEVDFPEVAFQLALAGGQRVDVFSRTTNLINAGKLPLTFLRAFTHWVGNVRVTLDQMLAALEMLLPKAEAGDRAVTDTAVDYLAAAFNSNQLPALLSARPRIVWGVLKAFTTNPGVQGAFWWSRIMDALVHDDVNSSVKLACLALVSDRYELQEDASQLLATWSLHYPTEIMDEVGRMMLDEKSGIKFFFSKFHFFSALPVGVVTAWLSNVGERGAEKIARHLPAPFINETGAASVPELTAWVLRQFESNERVFREFCAGVHSFQMYRGDAALAHDAEAAAALKFSNHPLKRIRQWAQFEYDSAIRNAELQREIDDAHQI
jgi:hypothetical protein